jgi:superfamily II DNA or RNA helicase
LLIIGDEIHRAGSPKTLAVLEQIATGGTMGLSATYKRQFDEGGSKRLVQVFGPVLDPQIGIAEAILMGRLVPYDYRLHTCSLTDEELARYARLTDKVRRWANRTGGAGVDDALRHLLIARARILKQASSKVPTAADLLTDEFSPGDRWLVYCDDRRQVRELTGELLIEGLPVMEYFSGMPGDRGAVLSNLTRHGGIVVAIRCLDEGVDIPTVDNALILASSTVQREYIQRRGRILRYAPDKLSATVHDLLLVDDHGGALTKSEALRALEFARLARNSAATEHLRLLIALSPDVALTPDETWVLEEYENGEEV